MFYRRSGMRRDRRRSGLRPNSRSERCTTRALLGLEPLEVRQLLTVVISEFMASNQSTISDRDGDWPDWIELENRGSESVNLDGWFLTDRATNLDKWRLPEVHLAAGDQLLIYASEKDRTDPQQELHTNFKLAAEGEYLGLVRPDGTTVEFAYAPQYPPQTDDVSYGLAPGGEAQGYFPEPSPGQANPVPPVSGAGRSVVINELMYSLPRADLLDAENIEEEFIELYNRGTQPVDVTGWRLTRGVEFEFPSATIPVGGFLVVAADADAFAAKYAGVTNYVAGWTGKLGNSGETLEIVDQAGLVVDSVRYADEGDWGVRAVGPEDRGSQGWIWAPEHDGGGKSLELINAAVDNNVGQNWTASIPLGGTPGAANSTAASDIAPLIQDVLHQPAIPRSTDPVTITAHIQDEAAQGVVAELHWRVDGAASFQTAPMFDDGQHADGEAGDHVYAATLPAQPDRTVVEFYVAARDATGHSRTWPAPTADGLQVTNALYQVLDNADLHAAWQPGTPPVYLQIMTGAERNEFTNIDRRSNAQFNATFIALTGTGADVRYNVGVRIRGSGSRTDPVPGNRINFPSDRAWQGITQINVNARNVVSQAAGAALFNLAGVDVGEVHPVRMFSNGVNLTGGFYVHSEVLNTEYAENHYPLDPNGNIYRGRRIDESPPGGQGAGLLYLGEDPAAYVSYTKYTNASEADWSDVIELTRVLKLSPDSTYADDVQEVMNVDEWFRALAMNSLIDNNEFSLMTGDPTGDDYVMYRGVVDSRFELIPYDWDTLFGSWNRAIFRETALTPLNRLVFNPEFLPRYYAQYLDLIDNVILTDYTNTTLDQALGAIATPNQIAGIKDFLVRRAAYVRGLINEQLTVDTGLPVVNGFPQTGSSTVNLTGTSPVAETRSVLVNGLPAQTLDGEGRWSFQNLTGETVTLIPRSSIWKFLDDGSNQGTAWRQPGYNDSSWDSGPGQLGFGDGDEATIVDYGGDENNKYITTYFRSTFQVDNHQEVAGLSLELLYDDGAVVYINGVEVARGNLNPNPDYLTLANLQRGRQQENVYVPFVLPAAAMQSLVAGENEIAVEIHQYLPTDPDLGFDLQLTAILQGVDLRPGINRLVVEAYDGRDGTGQVVASQLLDIWYDDGSTQAVSGTISSDTTWTAVGGPYRVTGNLTIAPSATLTIEPGTTVFFANNARMTVNGRLVAVGTPHRNIRFTREPGSSSWTGIQFVDSMRDNQIDYGILEYGITNDGLIGLENSQLTLQHSILDHTDRRRIRSIDSSLIVRDSTFTNIFEPGQAPTTDNLSEHIWGGGIPEGGHWIVEGNTFGTITGHNDAIDFDAPRLPSPIPRILNNVFQGGGDDALDMTGDVYIEGNVFRNYIKDQFNTDPGQSNTISSSSGDFWVVRNVFDNVQHASLVKENAYMYFLNNSVIGSEFATLYFDLAGQTSGPGRGAFVQGSLFADSEVVFAEVLPTTDLQVSYSYLPSSETVTDANNLVGDPHVWGAEGDYQLRPGSRAAGSGPNGADIGARIPAGATIGGIPPAVTARTSASLTVGGPAITEYRYRLDAGAWSSPRDVQVPINLVGLAPGVHQVAVIGKNRLGDWQAEDQATLTPSWTVNPQATSQLRINEILANNVSITTADGATPDRVELYNAGTARINLGGMSLSDRLDQPRKFVFPSGSFLAAGQYLVLHADNQSTAGVSHLGFGLDQTGDELYLFDAQGMLIDAVQFGQQIADLSIGVVDRDGNWGLTDPTFDPAFGNANRPTPLGDAAELRINEWYASGDVRIEQDFVEIYNPQSVPVALEGLYLTDKPFAIPEQSPLAALSFIPAQGYVSYVADGDPQDGPDHVNFRLSAVQEHLALVSSDGQMLDHVYYYPQTSEVSQGRVPDGGPDYAFSGLPTPGVTNSQGSTEVIPLLDFSWDSSWKYQASGQNLGTAWREPGYDDSTWPSGPGLLGREGSDIGEPIRTDINIDTGAITFYFRKTIQLDADPAEIDASFFTMIDDGAIVYVNGNDALRLRLPQGQVDWQELADSVTNASVEGPFTIPSEYFVRGENVIAVEVHQSSTNSSDLVLGMDFSATVTRHDPQFNDRDRLLNDLRITEIMYHPSEDTPLEFVELYNRGTEELNLNGVRLDGGIQFTFPNIRLPAGESVVVAENLAALLAEYGSGVHAVGQYQGNLGNSGDEIILQLPTPYDAAILRFAYDATWYSATSSAGRSLEIVDANLPFAAWGDKTSWQAGAVPGGTPGYQSGTLPPSDGIVINEVLSHTDLPLQDAIELHNTGAQSVNLGGWFLSDSRQMPSHYRIPNGTFIAGGGYQVFTEEQFNPSAGTDPNDFALDGAHGDTVWLWKPSATGEPAYIVDRVKFGAAANGESFGRYPNGVGELTPLQSRSLGFANGLPRVGPVLISEVNYHPTDPIAAALQLEPSLVDEDLEFVEIHNPTSTGVALNGWRLANGIDYAFDPSTYLSPGASLLVVSFDPAAPENASRLAAFRVHYGLASTAPIVGGYSGRLSNGGDEVQLLRADDPPIDEPDFVPLLLEDEIRYDDAAPWPTAPDGLGATLTRVLPAQLGREATSWVAANPTPAAVVGSPVVGDFNADLVVDAADINLLSWAIRNEVPDYDLNADGSVNQRDLDDMVHRILSTNYGDANLDRYFDSNDLVFVFIAGKYEDNLPMNAGWEEGDWDGDGDFSSDDFIIAFQSGAYEAASNAAAAVAATTTTDTRSSEFAATIAGANLAAQQAAPVLLGASSDQLRAEHPDTAITTTRPPQYLDDAVDRCWATRDRLWFAASEVRKPSLDLPTLEDVILARLEPKLAE